MLTASDPGMYDAFGWGVSIDGDYAIAGAHTNDDNGSSSGSAYMYKKDANGTYVQIQKLLALDAEPGDFFGYKVAISGSYAIVGAYGDDDNGTDAGSAYIFTNDGSDHFVQTVKLIGLDTAAGDEFGRQVAINNDYAVVGAWADDDNGTSSGSIYIFKNSGSGVFVQTQKIIAYDAEAFDNFGRSVAIDGDYLIIGSKNDLAPVFGTSSAYIYKKDVTGTFSFIGKIHSSDNNVNDFGNSVDINAQYAVVGASGNDDNNSNAGSAYIFKNDGNDNFIETNKLLALDAAAGDFFGYSVCIEGNYAVIGAYGNDDNGSNSGSAYIFENDGNGNFIQIEKLLASDAAASDQFGAEIAISTNHIIIGAHDNTINFNGYDYTGAGSAYIFKSSAKPASSPALLMYLLN